VPLFEVVFGNLEIAHGKLPEYFNQLLLLVIYLLEQVIVKKAELLLLCSQIFKDLGMLGSLFTSRILPFGFLQPHQCVKLVNR